MSSVRAELTPQMIRYAEKFDDRSEIRWMPYLMYFHPAGYRSEVVNTDRLGFRCSDGGPGRGIASVGGSVPDGPVRLLAGSSTVFGIGATGDAATMPSRLWNRYAPSAPWLNFGGRSHNSTQELLLFVLYRHLLPPVEHVILFSGFNDLGLSRLPAAYRGDSGAFFNCGQWLERTGGRPARGRGLPWRRAPEPAAADEPLPDLPEQIALAVELTLRNLDTWRLLTEATGARLTYVLQPLATWVRPEPAPQERLLFAELDEISDFRRVYGDIAAPEAGRRYADELRAGCTKLGVPFVNFGALLAEAIGPDNWLFVDRIHFTDAGYDLAAGLLADALELT